MNPIAVNRRLFVHPGKKEVVRAEFRRGRQNQSSLDQISQLSNVAWKVIAPKFSPEPRS